MSDKRKTAQATDTQWLKVLLAIVKWTWIPIVCAGALLAGLMIGYVYIGNRPASEAFELSTWRHIYDLIFSNT
ncbi:DNA-directed RNA polymerase subunit beta [Paenibacillus sp. YYML68]|uniref:DNA-directed RNA polymerase subunit beta n=1 Tax=Paenibacillus sp. YYML68 TaxID=2909250 RepID=UPI00249298EC|nr:DNA-directed RNA polymerase subunit beta [Paenibacillus sp. YYML68]